jgi:sugar/nucleoside kinase (ribokinase family)
LEGNLVAPRVIALGELLVEVMRKDVDQPLSQPGEFVGPFPSGAPAIFIDAVARLGVPSGFVGVVGADDFGECVVGRLRADAVDTAHVRTAPGYTTGIAFVAYRSDGSRKFVFHLPQSAAALLNPNDVDADYIARADFVHVTGSALSIGESARQACYRAIQLCKAVGGRVSFDPNIRPELLGIDQVRELCQPVLDQCDLLLPSGPEATMLTGDVDEETACRSLVERGIPIVALKRGEKGSTVFTTDQTIEVPSVAVMEVDPTGAGDCYGGAFVVGLLEGWDLPRVARFANVVGALAVTRRGAMEGAPWREDVLERM